MKKFDMAMLGAININLALRPVDKSMFERDVTRISDFGMTLGGDAMNEAITAAHLDNRVLLCGKVGDDAFGSQVLRQAQQHGIDISGVVRGKGECTAVGTQLISERGDRRIVSFRGAIESYVLEEVPMDLIRQAAILSIGSFNMLKCLEGPGITAILREAKNAGLITSADSMSDTYGFSFELLKPHFPYLDYFIPSYEEAVTMSGERKPARIAAFFRKLGCGNVVIKMGADGCYIQNNQFDAAIAACPTRPIDTTGAGDNFVAGFLTAVKQGMDLLAAARYGNAVAAISVQHMGSSGAIQSVEQVDQYRKQMNYE